MVISVTFSTSSFAELYAGSPSLKHVHSILVHRTGPILGYNVDPIKE